MSHVKMISTEVTEQIAKTLIGEDNFNKEELKRVIQKSVEKEENVYPMIPSGMTVHDMIEEPSDKKVTV